MIARNERITGTQTTLQFCVDVLCDKDKTKRMVKLIAIGNEATDES